MTGESNSSLPTSYSLEEAARLLGVSPQTVRRRLDNPDDQLTAAAGNRRPIRVSFESLQAARRSLAEELGLHLDPPRECKHPHVDELLSENERLRRLVLTLRLAQQELLHNIGDFTDPVLPNN
jgi:signal recognition particle subunit SEC65